MVLPSSHQGSLFAEERFTSLLDQVDVIVHVGLPATSKAYRLWKQETPQRGM